MHVAIIRFFHWLHRAEPGEIVARTVDDDADRLGIERQRRLRLSLEQFGRVVAQELVGRDRENAAEIGVLRIAHRLGKFDPKKTPARLARGIFFVPHIRRKCESGRGNLRHLRGRRGDRQDDFELFVRRRIFQTDRAEVRSDPVAHCDRVGEARLLRMLFLRTRIFRLDRIEKDDPSVIALRLMKRIERSRPLDLDLAHDRGFQFVRPVVGEVNRAFDDKACARPARPRSNRDRASAAPRKANAARDRLSTKK